MSRKLWPRKIRMRVFPLGIVYESPSLIMNNREATLFPTQVSVPSPLRSIRRLSMISPDSLDAANIYSDILGYFPESYCSLVQCN